VGEIGIAFPLQSDSEGPTPQLCKRGPRKHTKYLQYAIHQPADLNLLLRLHILPNRHDLLADLVHEYITVEL